MHLHAMCKPCVLHGMCMPCICTPCLCNVFCTPCLYHAFACLVRPFSCMPHLLKANYTISEHCCMESRFIGLHCHSSCITHHVPPIMLWASWLLITHCSLSIAYHALFIVYCLSCIVHCLLCSVHCLLYIIYCLSCNTHYSAKHLLGNINQSFKNALQQQSLGEIGHSWTAWYENKTPYS